MGQDSKIEWTHHTFNPWRGCTKVSAGCANCYAETLSRRNPKALGVWGPNGDRVVAAEAYWRQAIKWNAEAEAAGSRRRVFCASLADVLEGADSMPSSSLPRVRAARVRLFEIIRTTPSLDWLLLTKRPENWRNIIEETLILAQGGDPDDKNYFADRDGSFPKGELACWLNEWAGGSPPENVWLGTSVEDQKAADERIPHLLKCPAAVRFLSVEPMLGAIDLQLQGEECDVCGNHADTEGIIEHGRGCYTQSADGGGISSGEPRREIHWIIVGGESGHGARPFNLEWARSIVSQCKRSDVACFIKQLGGVPVDEVCECGDFREQHAGDGPCGVCSISRAPYDGCKRFRGTGRMEGIHISGGKGGDINEFPIDLRIREMPKAAETQTTKANAR